MSRVTITDVAREVGVSVSTVSLVLNNKPGRISDETRERVHATAEKLGYRPNKVAQNLRRQETKTIGLISDSIATTPFAGQMLAGALDAAREKGYLLTFIDTGMDSAVQQQAVNRMLGEQVDALILAAMWHREILLPQGVPNGTVLMDCFDEFNEHAAVVPDERGGARSAVELLVSAGHRRIAYVDVDEHPGPIAAAMRYESYREVLYENGIVPDEALHVCGASSHIGGRKAAEQLLALPREERPTAIFCFNDRMAAGVYTAIRHAGLRIPIDLSVVGYDDQQLVAAELDPPLTTVALPHYQMGRWAVHTALGCQTAPQGEPFRMLCPLIERESVAPPPNEAPTTPGGGA